MKTPLIYYLFTIVFLLPFLGNSQFVAISGTIKNEKSGKIIENANIFERQSTIGTISDKFGFYKLMLKPGKIDLLITCDGYIDFHKKIELVSDTALCINLKPIFHLKGKRKNEAELQATSKSELPETGHLRNKWNR